MAQCRPDRYLLRFLRLPLPLPLPPILLERLWRPRPFCQQSFARGPAPPQIRSLRQDL
ncbi:hypothetical protein MTBUT4_810003 [Magnetospirillum sp. UT-4]|nr:hypothetical protein MTBUT4_810003 [Magnetospirillum sp. UT-4]